MLSVVENKSSRVIARELGLAPDTVLAYIRAESELRSKENETRREFNLSASLEQYKSVIRAEWGKSHLIEGRMLEHDKGALRIVDTTAANIIAAQTRIDKLLGLEAASTVNVNILQPLLDALEPEPIDVTPQAIESE